MIYVTDREQIEKYSEDKYFNLYAEKMTEFFKGAPPARKGTYAYDAFPFKNGLHEYLINLYPLFNRITNFELPDEIGAGSGEYIDYEKAAKFLKAIYFSKVQRGRRINRYTEGWRLPLLIRRLVKFYNGNYYLLNNDVESLDYKLALLSAVDFDGDGQEIQFSKKLIYWAELHASDT